MHAKPLNPDLPPCDLGEGVFWDSQEHCLYWVDIDGQAVHRYDPARREHCARPAPYKVSFAISATHRGLITGMGPYLMALDFATGQTTPLFTAQMPDGNRFNDGKCDPRGRLWAGTMMEDKNQPAPSAVLYRLDAQGAQIIESNLVTANGKGWSPDGTTMYHTDTEAHTIWAYDFDMDSGTLSNKRVLIDFADQKPDGMCVDAEGNLYVALFGGSAVDVFTQHGELSERITVPTAKVTSCCFGGDDLKTLFITTAKSDTPLSGHVFTAEVQAPGLPNFRFQF